MEITEALETIINARYGREVRQAIHDGIKQAYEDAIANGNANMEVSQARGSYPTLADRLTNDFGNVSESLTELLTKLDGRISKGQVTMADLTQEVKEALTGGAVAVVGEDAVGTVNIIDDSITTHKIVNRAVIPDHLSSEIVNISRTSNRLDKDSVDIRTGGYLSAGKFIENESYITSHKIYVRKGDIIRYGFNEGMGANHAIFVYDFNGNYLGSAIGDTDAQNRYRQVVIDNENADHIYVSYSNNGIQTAMLTVNSAYPNSYQPFNSKMTLSENFELNEKQKRQVSALVKDNELIGKIVSFNGDSIMAGAGYEGGFAKIISESNDMTYQNIAVGGGTIAGDTKYQDGRNRHCVSRTIGDMRSDADYAIILAGVNDGAVGVPMGEYTSEYTDDYDDTTFCGAVESMCSQLIQRFDGKKVGFIIPHKMSPAQETYVPKLIDGLKKWGIPYLNLYDQIPSLNYIPHLKTNYTHNADGWHPNEAGYRQYYVDKVEAWMKEL